MTEAPKPMIEPAHPSRRVLRWNAALTVVLLLVVVALGNVFAARHLNVRRDISSDGLNVISDATRRIVGRIEDRLSVRLYANAEVRDGQLALRGARIRAQLDEILGLRKDVFDLQLLDPSRSSEARRQAREARLEPTHGSSTGLGSAGDQEVWLGIVLGYRGRTETIPRPDPWGFEVQIASALHSLLSDRKVGIAWIGAPFEPPPNLEGTEARIESSFSTFRIIRNSLQRRGRLVTLPALELGRQVPKDVDILFVVRPTGLHERTVYEIDQFVQRGGRLVVCIDDPDYNLLVPRSNRSPDDFPVTALGKLLDSWGIRIADRLIWDEDWKTARVAVSMGSDGRPRQAQVSDPLVITVPTEGLDPGLLPTRGLPGVQFAWAHPIFPLDTVAPPAGVTRTDLAWSSSDARIADVAPYASRDQRAIRSRSASLRTRSGGKHAIAAVFAGLFPSPWAGKSPPAPYDPLEFGRGRAEDTPPLSAQTSSQVVVFGDADWLRDPVFTRGTFVSAGGGVLAINLVDWLTLDEDLIGLRSRVPTLRPLRDFVTEAERDLGLFEEDRFPTEAERIEAGRKGDLARRRAQRKQWLMMLAPALSALLIVALFGVTWIGLGRRQSEPEGGTR